MKLHFLYALLLSGAFCACGGGAHPMGQTENWSEQVNPFIGTDFTGNTYPGAQAPFGMVQLSPDNGRAGWDYIAGYFWPDSTIAGFSHTHLSGTGAGDLYDISFMPVTLPYQERQEGGIGIYSRFSHDDEQAQAGYYKVLLKDYGIQVELTATERCGVQRYTFPSGKQAAIFLNLKKAMNWDFTNDSYIHQVDSCTVEGYRFSEGWARDQRVYFRSRFSRPFTALQLDTTVVSQKGRRIGTACVARFDFSTASDSVVTVVTALSGVSLEGAKRNLQAEAPHNDFSRYVAEARKEWNSQLGKIEVEGGTLDDRVKFYTALYHAMLAPTIFSDVDGQYRGADKQIHRMEKGAVNYSTFSLWDTFRASHPLFTYLQPQRTADMVQSFLAFYEQHGRLPLWPLWGAETEMMIGYHAVPVIVDAYLKGIGDFDAGEALDACVASADQDDYRGLRLYKQYGYIPYNLSQDEGAENWSLSKTLEYAYDDWCIARMAEKLGKEEIADRFRKRSGNWRNLFNPATGFIQPRDDKGNFLPGFSPDDYSEYICESNGWHYLWSVQHDVDGLMAALGGQDRLESRLDSMFTYVPADKEGLPIFSTGMIGQYAHGNEPSHHVIFLYNRTQSPWKAQKYVSQVMHELYLNTPAGLCGNEDCGQMSAWFVFNAMGFYPVDPVSGKYEIGTPLFPKLKLHLVNGKTFTVLAPGVSRKNCYIQEVKVNGQPYHETFLTHEQIMSGATVEFILADKPCSRR